MPGGGRADGRREVFEAYLRPLPGACPGADSGTPGQVVLMDNLSAHKGGGVRRRIIESAGCELCCISASLLSPDLNPT